MGIPTLGLDQLARGVHRAACLQVVHDSTAALPEAAKGLSDSLKLCAMEIQDCLRTTFKTLVPGYSSMGPQGGKFLHGGREGVVQVLVAVDIWET